MSFYSRIVLPRLLNLAMAQKPMTKVRRSLLPEAWGEALEIGFGSGMNLPFYNTETCHSLTAVDPSPEMLSMAAEKESPFGANLHVLQGSAEELQFPDNAFDSVVCTWTLCSVSEPQQSLAEIRRVLRPGGVLLFAEHSRAPDTRVYRWQKRINPLWKRLAGNCHLDRPTLSYLEESGLKIEHLRSGYLPGPKWATYTHSGAARALK